jgi:dCMP deaminase
MNEAWYRYFMDMANLVASKSKDPSTKCGCVIVAPDKSVRSTGFNGFPRGCMDYEEIYADRPRKLARVVHSEINAIVAAAKSGTSTDGCTIFVNFHPCSQCAAAIINAGITCVVCPPIPEVTNWKESFIEARILLGEASVQVAYFTENT